MVLLQHLALLHKSAPPLNEYRLLSLVCVASTCVLLQSALICYADEGTGCEDDSGWAFALSLIGFGYSTGLLLLVQIRVHILGGKLYVPELLLLGGWLFACVKLTFQSPFHLVGNGYLGCWAACFFAGRLAAEHFSGAFLGKLQAWVADPLAVLLVASAIEATQTVFIFAEETDHVHIIDMATRSTALVTPAVMRIDRSAEEMGIVFGVVSSALCSAHFLMQSAIARQFCPSPRSLTLISCFSRLLAIFCMGWWTAAVILLTFHHPYLTVCTGYIASWVAWSASLAYLYNVVGTTNVQKLSNKVPEIPQLPELAILPLLSMVVLAACLADPVVALDTELNDKTLFIIITCACCAAGAVMLLCFRRCGSSPGSDKHVEVFGAVMAALWATLCFISTFGRPFRLLCNGSLAAWAAFVSAVLLVRRQASALGHGGHLDSFATLLSQNLELAIVACCALLMVVQGAHDSIECEDSASCEASYNWAVFTGIGSLAIAAFSYACSRLTQLQTLFRWCILLLSIWWSVSLGRFTFYGPYVFADIAFVACWMAFTASWTLCVKLWPECLGRASDQVEFLDKPSSTVINVVPASNDQNNLQRNMSFEKRGWGLDLVEEADELKSLRALLHVPDPENLGWGRDVRAKGKYKSLELVHAWRIDAPQRSKVYQFKKEVVNKEVKLLKDSSFDITTVKTKLDEAANGLAVLDDSISEKLLLHGTKPEHALSILHNGLNEKLSGGLFGKGVYLAEDPSKIDQYCTIDSKLGAGDANVLELQKMLYKNDTKHSGQLLYCFVARAVLGFPICTKDGENNMSAPFQPIFVTADKRELTQIPNSTPPMFYHSLIAEAGKGNKVERHREFIVFDGDRLLLEYLLAYRRK